MEIKKALTFRASSIGDCLMGKYLLENIHRQFPHARLGIVIASRARMIRDVLAAYSWLEVIEANRRSPAALFSLWKDFRGSDVVVTQYAGKPGGSFGLGSKFAARLLASRGGLIGFVDTSPWNDMLYDRLLPVNPHSAVAEHERAVLRAIGTPIASPFPTLAFMQNELILAQLNLTKGTFVFVHLFAGNTGRSLHPEKKSELLEVLAKQLPGVRLLVSGGPADREEALYITRHIPAATVLAGEITLQECMNLVVHSRGVVSVDTGMAHIAVQLGKPLVVLRSCVAPNWWFSEQYGTKVPLAVCEHDTVCAGHHRAKAYPDCINGIRVEDVAKRAQEKFSIV